MFVEKVNKFLKEIFGDWIEVDLSESGRQACSMIDFDINEQSVKKLLEITKIRNHPLSHLITNDNSTYWKPLWESCR